MTQILNKRRYDLEERTLKFAHKVNDYVNQLPRTITNVENGRQLTRSGGSIGANYIEANTGLGKRDFVMHIKVCRKEAKETRYWLTLTEPSATLKQEKRELLQEVTELIKIFNAILEKSK